MSVRVCVSDTKTVSNETACPQEAVPNQLARNKKHLQKTNAHIFPFHTLHVHKMGPKKKEKLFCKKLFGTEVEGKKKQKASSITVYISFHYRNEMDWNKFY